MPERKDEPANLYGVLAHRPLTSGASAGFCLAARQSGLCGCARDSDVRAVREASVALKSCLRLSASGRARCAHLRRHRRGSARGRAARLRVPGSADGACRCRLTRAPQLVFIFGRRNDAGSMCRMTAPLRLLLACRIAAADGDGAATTDEQ